MIRLASKNDISSIDACNRRNLFIHYPRDFYASFFSNKFNVGVVCEVADKIVGYVLMVVHRQLFGKSVGHVFSIAVDELHRCCGIGSNLLSFAESTVVSQNQNLTTFFLHARKRNKKVVKWYNKHGYWRSKIRKNYYDNPKDDALVMTKTLI